MHRKSEKPYHIDYMFAKKNIYDKIESFEIGKYEDWIGLSDHTPIFSIIRMKW